MKIKLNRMIASSVMFYKWGWEGGNIFAFESLNFPVGCHDRDKILLNVFLVSHSVHD